MYVHYHNGSRGRNIPGRQKHFRRQVQFADFPLLFIRLLSSHPAGRLLLVLDKNTMLDYTCHAHGGGIGTVETGLTLNQMLQVELPFPEPRVLCGLPGPESGSYSLVSLLILSPISGENQGEIYLERYRSGHNGADSKSCGQFGTSILKTLDFTRVPGHRSVTNFLLSLLIFSPTCREQFRVKITWRGIEAVITGLTRNQFALQRARGFESHPLRHPTRLKRRFQAGFRVFGRCG